ncbi:ZIP family metal transporter [Metamycoplasma hominis]|uniref:hypothetical protein n=1 Tax=Metamycoplasma hominis TaxID=2098 RepID=UPI000DED644E|nr:hypothetical protein [Metamycoplasma hominis]AYK04629.1 hypothetical protein D9D13_01490 [Metamycoplasma hominis]QKX39441.1 hypothetical protein HU158_01425 [Metamycoplasma hominis]QKX40530.1 hypothetical protein HU160_01525 [Metamycoplasma hominis]RCJ00270.1 hypothetical protein DSL65_01485 [Metamycoplasma hominis]RCJ01927.1 hypothetical protein DSL67_01420 [Metamycoplasma hominis]
MFIGTSAFNGNITLATFVNLIIYILILLGVPSLVLGVISIFKLKITDKKNIYIYAFATGMFLMIGTVGFFKESFDWSNSYLHGLRAYSETNIPWIQAAIIGLSALLGLILVILGRFIFVKYLKTDVHADHDKHNHSDHLFSIKDFDNPRAAWGAILMLMSHRIIDGLFLGYNVYTLTSIGGTYKANIPLIITFNIHILLEILVVYYRQIQYGEKKSKAILYNFLTFLLIIPFMLIGGLLGQYIEHSKVFWIIPSFLALGGGIITFMSIFELVPEFIHVRNQSPKVLYTSFALFSLGLVLTIVILCFHTHTATAF